MPRSDRVILSLLVVLALAGGLSGLLEGSLLPFSPVEQHSLFILAPPGTRDVPQDHPAWDGDPRAFDLLDLDRDGSLTVAELAEAGTAWRALFFLPARADLDLDGRVTRDEAERTRPDPAVARLLGDGWFSRLDADRDGGLTPGELVEGGRALRLGPERLPALDRDGDGRLSRDEFPGAPATRAFVLGTDYQGRDLLVRVLYGVRLSLLVGVAAAGLSFLLGVCWGGAAGFLGGLAGRAMMRGVDVLYAVPFLFVIVILVVLLGPGTGNLLLAIALVQWMPLARVFRGEVARLKGTDLYSAGRLLGLSGPRILFRHLLPNALTPVLPFGTLLVPAAILDEAFLSFLGLGVRPPTPSIGIAIVDGVHGVGSNAFSLAAPALALALILIGFYRLGDVLRRKL